MRREGPKDGERQKNTNKHKKTSSIHTNTRRCGGETKKGIR
jgi:hypothetical protein